MSKKGEPTLTEEARTYAVQALACFDPPSVVAEAIRKEFGAKITPQAVEAYDPTKRAGRKIAAGRRALFEETRRVFLESQATIGVSHRTVRLRTINRMVDRAEGMGNLALAAQLLEQAAKEVGDAYTNKVKVAGDPNGAPIATSLTVEFV